MRVKVARPPPTMESTRSSLRPGTEASRSCRRELSRLDDLLDPLALEQVAVQAGQRIGPGALVDLGQVADGAPGPHQAAAAAQGGQVDLLEHLAHVGRQAALVAGRGGIGGEEGVGQAQRPQGEAPLPADAPVPRRG